MTQQQFQNEIRRGLITIMRACIKYFGMGWADFIPRDNLSVVTELTPNQSATVYHLDVAETRPGS